MLILDHYTYNPVFSIKNSIIAKTLGFESYILHHRQIRGRNSADYQEKIQKHHGDSLLIIMIDISKIESIKTAVFDSLVNLHTAPPIDASGRRLSNTVFAADLNISTETYTEVHTGSTVSPLWEKTTTDMPSRTVKIEKPGYSGTETTENFYNNQGHLSKTSTPGRADSLYEYDTLGNRTRSGLDINNNGILEPISDDRINSNLTQYLYNGTDWWLENTQKIFDKSNTDQETTTGTSRNRLTGMGTSGLLSETVSTDIHGNQTVSTTHLNKPLHKITQTIDYPDSTTNAVTETIYGLQKSSMDKSGITTTFQYDTLERRTGVTDPRTGQAITHYNSKGEIDYQEDAANKRTAFAYDSITGRKTSVTDAENRTVYYLYDNLDHITHTWGATSPIRYEYNQYGRMTTTYSYDANIGELLTIDYSGRNIGYHTDNSFTDNILYIRVPQSHLLHTATRGRTTNATEYQQNNATNSWVLCQGSGVRVTTRNEQTIGDITIQLKTTSNNASQVFSRVEKSYNVFSWGVELITPSLKPAL